MWWNEAPFARLIILLIAGIVLYEYYPELPATAPFSLLCAAYLLWWIIGKSPHFFLFKYTFGRALLVQLALINLAYLLAQWHDAPKQRVWFKSVAPSYNYLLVRIAEELQHKTRSLKSVVEIKQLVSRNDEQQASGKVLAYFQPGSKSLSLRHGDIILIRNQLQPIRQNSNPGGFDYAKWCKRQQVLERVYLQDKDWQPTSVHHDDIFSYVGRLGLWTKKILSRYITDKSALGIAEALLIGYREDIDSATWEAYSRTGIVHIIAISGMHMALVYGSMRWLLSLLPFRRHKQKVGIGISLGLMWVFAVVTGMPASVTRAAVMLTFVGVGEMLKKEVSGLNNLCASGFMLMCFNPNLLFDVGFQLSFIAVLSLILFQQSVYQLLTIQNRVADWIWQLTAVTISAQILTFPVCVYYFHQFPLLFLLTNLVAIPLTTLVLYLEILLLSMVSFDSVAGALGYVIEKGILFLNLFINRVGNLGFAVWSELQINLLQMAFFYVLIMSIFLWLCLKKVTYLLTSLFIMLSLLATFCFDQWKLNQQMSWIVYDSRKQKNLDFIQGENYYSPDEAALSKEAKQYTHIPAHIFFQVKSRNDQIVSKARTNQLEIFRFGHDTLIRLTGHQFHSKRTLKTDYLILSDDAAPSATFISKSFVCNQIIIDNSIPIRKARKLAESYIGLGMPVHVVQDQGAFVRHLNH